MSTTLGDRYVEITTQGETRFLYKSNTVIGFYRNTLGWMTYANNDGQWWSNTYGWLHDYFFSSVENCIAFRFGGEGYADSGPLLQSSNVIYGGTDQLVTGTQPPLPPPGPPVWAGYAPYPQQGVQLVDNGSSMRLRRVRNYYNCLANCDCVCD